MKFAFRTALERPLIGVIAFWIILLGCVVAISNRLVAGSFHGENNWKPFDVTPIVFFPAVALLLISGVSLTWLLIAGRKSKVGLGVSLATLVSSILLAIASTKPGAGSVNIRDTINGADPAPSIASFGIPILFSNGSDKVDPGPAQALAESMSVFRECQTTKVFARGFSSSARYSKDSDNENLFLANRRANNVAIFLARQGYRVTPVVWTEFGEMTAARRAIDVKSDGSRSLGDELRNRRVEVIWHESPCSGI